MSNQTSNVDIDLLSDLLIDSPVKNQTRSIFADWKRKIITMVNRFIQPGKYESGRYGFGIQEPPSLFFIFDWDRDEQSVRNLIVNGNQNQQLTDIFSSTMEFTVRGTKVRLDETNDTGYIIHMMS